MSGLLQCHICGAHFVVADKEKYACSSYVNGGVSACSNKVRVRRDVLERRIIGPITDEVLDPARLRCVVAQLQKQFSDCMGPTPRHDANSLCELAQLDARLDRLRERLRRGDPDMEPDELQMAIDWAQTKRRHMVAPALPDSGMRDLLSMLPKLADMYRKQIVAGLNGNPEATARARSIMRELIGVVMITAEGAQVWCEFEMHPDVLLRAAGREVCGSRFTPNPVGSDSGVRSAREHGLLRLESAGGHDRAEQICAIPAMPVRIRLK